MNIEKMSASQGDFLHLSQISHLSDTKIYLDFNGKALSIITLLAYTNLICSLPKKKAKNLLRNEKNL